MTPIEKVAEELMYYVESRINGWVHTDGISERPSNEAVAAIIRHHLSEEVPRKEDAEFVRDFDTEGLMRVHGHNHCRRLIGLEESDGG